MSVQRSGRYDGSRPDRHNSRMTALTLGALGVVFGDIGTSPLYAVQTVFTADNHAVEHQPGRGLRRHLAGLLGDHAHRRRSSTSTFILRADNDGEGGIMALTALLQKQAVQDHARQGHPGHARHLRRLAVLRRRHHHAGDLGALGGRGPEGRRARPESTACCRSRSPS